MASSVSLRHGAARQNPLALSFRRGRHHHHRIDALFAAGLEQQRHVHHHDRRAGALGIIEEIFAGRRRASGWTICSSCLMAAGLCSTLGGKFCPIDLAVDGGARETPLRSPAPPRLHRFCERRHRRRRPARRLPQTALRWWISPFRSSRSVQGSAFMSPFLSDFRQQAAARCAEMQAAAAAAGRES